MPPLEKVAFVFPNGDRFIPAEAVDTSSFPRLESTLAARLEKASGGTWEVQGVQQGDVRLRPRRPQKGTKQHRQQQQHTTPFVERYAPYTNGMGTSLVRDPVKEAEKMWNSFYLQNTTQGFKDRHYLTREVPEVAEAGLLLECGCGVGNTFFPLLEEHPRLQCRAFDLSKVAVRLAMANPLYDPARVSVVQHDATAAPIPASLLPDGAADVATLIFVLSAVAPAKMPAVVSHIAAKVRPGGVLYFRDYCRGDLAQERFASEARVGENFFMRTCGTCAYFFAPDEVVQLFSKDFEVSMCEKVERDVQNQKEGTTMHRVWIHARLKRKKAMK